jgi:hypothetical protein
VPEDAGVRASLAHPAALVDAAAAGPAQAVVHAIVRRSFPVVSRAAAPLDGVSVS